ncbi:hypothetical protein [Streptomyces sp. BRA346]|uniref:hypothetical protein n=1 Tax=Streptomyces sp. BRA346 TaxID=2878199 RepID=UPI004062A1A2
MDKKELTQTDRETLRKDLHGALQPLRDVLYEAMTEGRPDSPDVLRLDRPEGALASLAACKYAAEEIDGMAENFARSAGAKGANYAELGAAWGISRQAARKRWPLAVDPSAARGTRKSVDITAFGGTARVGFDPADGGWWWVAAAANGTNRDTGLEEDAPTYDTSEEAAAAAGAFLAANTTTAANERQGG